MTPRAPAMSPDDRRTSVVEVTIPLLREHGPALTTKQVAEAAGIAEGTLFKAFGTKEELVQACVAAALDSTPAVAALRGIDATLTLDERLVAGVTVMQQHVERIVGLIWGLHHAGAPGPSTHPKPQRRTDPAVDAAFADLVGPDAETLRKPVEEVVGLLQLLTLSSVHPLMSTGHLDAAEIVSVVLDGTRHHTDRETR
ncbi:TetR/AcrR family transcriptional regulator [Phycicoccus sp. HDW14]|uniref:TetR/AcrR family transcriptional regulator n=1 Tax=Phycicoccus sp. HDW14 TaxID=2714941 RepID=UPI00140A38C8|nr:TetR/AcrR family transcriptional regulator [Phycicoccus sp. HDW14]QIM22805.1 TetR/AcrR family transcriptional regulator [Phycicoccus sp. HDW14]